MAKPKSFLKNIVVDKAMRSHCCKHNSNHKIQSGEKRLRLKTNRSHEHFCVKCAVESINADMKKLEEIKNLLLEE
jgi:hypothetical protein